MANPTCTVASLRSNCFQGTVIDDFRRKCLMVYLMAAELKGIGGTDYTSKLTSPAAGGLLGDTILNLNPGGNTDSKDLFGCHRIGLYELGVQLNNALASGGTTATDINTRMQQIKCLINVNENTLDMMLVWLGCQLGVHKSYTQ